MKFQMQNSHTKITQQKQRDLNIATKMCERFFVFESALIAIKADQNGQKKKKLEKIHSEV